MCLLLVRPLVSSWTTSKSTPTVSTTSKSPLHPLPVHTPVPEVLTAYLPLVISSPFRHLVTLLLLASSRLSREVSDGAVAPGYTPEALDVLRRKGLENIAFWRYVRSNHDSYLLIPDRWTRVIPLQNWKRGKYMASVFNSVETMSRSTPSCLRVSSAKTKM